jgi:hypothetical protein
VGAALAVIGIGVEFGGELVIGELEGAGAITKGAGGIAGQALMATDIIFEIISELFGEEAGAGEDPHKHN